MSFIGYIRNTENKSDYHSQHEVIAAFAKENNLSLLCVYADSSFENIKSIIAADCFGVVIGNIACLGTTLPTIRDNLYFCKKQGLSLYSVAENYQFTKENLTDEMLRGIDLAIDVRYQMTSVITKKALAKKKEIGLPLGRKGRLNKKYVLTGRENLVYQLLEMGVPKVQIAKKLGVSITSLYNFLSNEPNNGQRGGFNA